MAISWNVVNRSGDAVESVRPKIRSKISKIEKLLNTYPEDAVHLQIIFSERPKDHAFNATLNLRIPSDVLQVNKYAKNPVTAFDDAVDVLVRRLKKTKARYRREYEWRNIRRKKMERVPVRFTAEPLVKDTGPQTYTDIVVRFFKNNYVRLLGFVNRQIHEFILAGSIPRNAIDPRDIVDRVAEKALQNPDLKPFDMDYYTWAASLALHMAREAVRDYREEKGLDIPSDLYISTIHGDVDDDIEPEDYEVKLLRAETEPGDIAPEEQIPGPEEEEPDIVAQEEELVSSLRAIARRWPKLERQVFEMYFLEDFSVDDVAVTLHCDREEAERAIATVRSRLKNTLSAITDRMEPVETTGDQEYAFDQHLARTAEKLREAGNRPDNT